MPFPHSKRVVYKTNPIVQVVCQLRFPTILAINAEPPARFQEQVRKDYPLYEKEDPMPGLPTEIAGLLSQLPLSMVPGTPIHKFLTPDSKRFISLANEWVALTEGQSSYTRWEGFAAEVKRAQEALEKVYEPAFYTRVGLRYQDTIDRERLGLNDVPWGALLKLPITGLLGADEVYSEVTEAQSVARLSLTGLPGGGATIRYGLRRGDDEASVFFVDADFFAEGRRTVHELFGALETLHNGVGDFFRWSITDRLEQALGPDPIGL